MSDRHLQDLRRAWQASQSVNDEAELLREQVRVGELAARDLELAAYLGHPAAQAVVPSFELPAGYRTWLSGLGAWSDRLALRGHALALACLVRPANTGLSDHFLEAARRLEHGDVLAQHAEHAALRELRQTEGGDGHGAGAWLMAVEGLSAPRRYLTESDPERLTAKGRLRARLSLPDGTLNYLRSEHRADGWLHLFRRVSDAGTEPCPPQRASPGWKPDASCPEGAPPGRGLFDTLEWSVPETPQLRAAVRAGLLPGALGRS